MSHSNRGLNEPFYKWIDDVRRAMRKEKELQEKLEFYNMKLIGYKGVSYDRIGSSGSRSSGDSELLYWLDKIAQAEINIEQNNKKLYEKYSFTKTLNNIELYVFNEILGSYDIKDNNLNKSLNKMTRQKIVRKWIMHRKATTE